MDWLYDSGLFDLLVGRPIMWFSEALFSQASFDAVHYGAPALAAAVLLDVMATWVAMRLGHRRSPASRGVTTAALLAAGVVTAIG